MAAISEARAANRTTSCQELDLLAGLTMVVCSAVSLTRRLSRVVNRQVTRLGRKDNRIWRETSAPTTSRDARSPHRCSPSNLHAERGLVERDLALAVVAVGDLLPS